MVNQFFNPFVGLYGNIYKAMFGAVAPRLAFKPEFIFTYVCLVGRVAEHGLGFDNLSGSVLVGIPDLHEAAQMDGASRLRRVISIDIPAIMPTIILLLIINVGQVMNLGLKKIYLMQNDVNLRLSEVISTLCV